MKSPRSPHSFPVTVKSNPKQSSDRTRAPEFWTQASSTRDSWYGANKCRQSFPVDDDGVNNDSGAGRKKKIKSKTGGDKTRARKEDEKESKNDDPNISAEAALIKQKYLTTKFPPSALLSRNAIFARRSEMEEERKQMRRRVKRREERREKMKERREENRRRELGRVPNQPISYPETHDTRDAHPEIPPFTATATTATTKTETYPRRSRSSIPVKDSNYFKGSDENSWNNYHRTPASRLDLVIPPLALRADRRAVGYIMGQLKEEDEEGEREKMRRDERIQRERWRFRELCKGNRIKGNSIPRPTTAKAADGRRVEKEEMRSSSKVSARPQSAPAQRQHQQPSVFDRLSAPKVAVKKHSIALQKGCAELGGLLVVDKELNRRLEGMERGKRRGGRGGGGGKGGFQGKDEERGSKHDSRGKIGQLEQQKREQEQSQRYEGEHQEIPPPITVTLSPKSNNEQADDFTLHPMETAQRQISGFEKNMEDHPYIIAGGDIYANPKSIYEV